MSDVDDAPQGQEEPDVKHVAAHPSEDLSSLDIERFDQQVYVQSQPNAMDSALENVDLLIAAHDDAVQWAQGTALVEDAPLQLCEVQCENGDSMKDSKGNGFSPPPPSQVRALGYDAGGMPNSSLQYDIIPASQPEHGKRKKISRGIPATGTAKKRIRMMQQEP